jgi:hypothetical protein
MALAKTLGVIGYFYLTMMTIVSMVFWDVIPYSLVEFH